jgi:hypothetical protein
MKNCPFASYESIRRSGGTVPLILNLGCRRRFPTSQVPGKELPVPTELEAGWPHSLFERSGEEKKTSSSGNRTTNLRVSSPLASLWTDQTTSARLTDYWTWNKWTTATGGNQHRSQGSLNMWERNASRIVSRTG